MPGVAEVNVGRHKTSLFSLFLVALLIALPVGVLAQAGGQGGRGGAGAGAPAGAPPAAGGAGAQAPGAGARGGAGGRGGGAPQAAPATARTSAPVDLTGYWVALVTEDWVERMSPDSPRSGVVARGGGGRGGGGGGAGGGGGRGGGQAAAAPPAAPADPCRAYAAGGSMRLATRLNVTWADDNTLKIDTDAGTQTRLLRFNAPPLAPGTPKSLQGYSVATWEAGGGGGRGGGGGGRGGGAPAAAAPAGVPPVPVGAPAAAAANQPAAGGRGGAAAAPRWGSLNVTTTNMSGGYLLTSRNTYSENAVLTEYFTRHGEFGNEYLTVTAQLVDGGTTRVVSSTFKKEPNGSKFSPTGCEIVR